MTSITNGYTTLKDLKRYLGIDIDGSDTVDDGDLNRIVNVVSRAIEHTTGTKFYAATETRYYNPTMSNRLNIDNCLSITTIKEDTSGDGVFDTTWAATDYQLRPRNAATGTPAEPYKWVSTLPNGARVFPTWWDDYDPVQIVGSFGYNSGTSTSAPDQIKQACLMGCGLMFEVQKTNLGVGGGDFSGTIEARRQIIANTAVMDLLNSVEMRDPVMLVT